MTEKCKCEDCGNEKPNNSVVEDMLSQCSAEDFLSYAKVGYNYARTGVPKGIELKKGTMFILMG